MLCSLVMILLNKGTRKIWIIFDVENLLWKSNFNTRQSIEEVCWFCKIFWMNGMSKVLLLTSMTLLWKVDHATHAIWKETRLLYINLFKIDLNQTAVIGLMLRWNYQWKYQFTIRNYFNQMCKRGAYGAISRNNRWGYS